MSAHAYSCILWDVDGTIADASAGILPRLRQVLASYGLPEPDADQLSLWIGPPMYESFERHAGMDPEQAQEAVARYRTLAASDGYAAAVEIYPGVPAVLDAVQLAGIPQATASTKPENQVRAILEHHELIDGFTAISGARSGPDGRTDGKAFVIGQALERLRAAGVDTSRPVLIGDRHHDIDGAAEYGIPVIFVDWGFGAESESDGAMLRVGDTAELQHALLG
ncbi:Phosphoglycolate phosphatase [Microbacterium esteraromaticum]|uniref:Phosphoglycolate phosphatase n=1 Tax=Microbacterium esteraromaticum TaxID=57043 RepID=A0A1R4K1I5_9MICO|nr:HAD hydrolase-like protein [Microbacterium esteraromaticum]SJN38024.1 Phosphoglycolate phosphatase [Microbacterium esteraromaticum]